MSVTFIYGTRGLGHFHRICALSRAFDGAATLQPALRAPLPASDVTIIDAPELHDRVIPDRCGKVLHLLDGWSRPDSAYHLEYRTSSYPTMRCGGFEGGVSGRRYWPTKEVERRLRDGGPPLIWRLPRSYSPPIGCTGGAFDTWQRLVPLEDAGVYIGSASTFALEAATAGVPLIITTATLGQRALALELMDVGAIFVKDQEGLDEALSYLSVPEIHRSRSARLLDLLDGKGAARLAGFLRERL